MASMPRILTVDPTGAVARVVRAALSLVDRPAIQVDVPGGAEALEEVFRGEFRLVITTLDIGADMKGFELALRVKQAQPDTGMILLADVNDPEDLDEETRAASPFLYMRRPVDPYRFIRVLLAALDNKDVMAAANAPLVSGERASVSTTPIPSLDLKAAQNIVDSLLTDVGAMAIVVANRSGDVLLERGAVGYIDREQMTSILLPSIEANMAIGTLVGGRTSALQIFDGDTYDLYVLSVGYHHFMCLIFDGQAGGRQLGAVNRYGRRAAEDMIALIGSGAMHIQPVSQPPMPPVLVAAAASEEASEVLPSAVPTDAFISEAPQPEEESLKLDPIENLDMKIFDQIKLESWDDNFANDMFDPEKLAEIANETRRDRGPLSYDEARELGIIP